MRTKEERYEAQDLLRLANIRRGLRVEVNKYNNGKKIDQQEISTARSNRSRKKSKAIIPYD